MVHTITAHIAAHPIAGMNATAPAPPTARPTVSAANAPQIHICECFMVPPLGQTIGRTRGSGIRASSHFSSVATTWMRAVLCQGAGYRFLAEPPNAGEYRGLEGPLRWRADWERSWESWRWVPEVQGFSGVEPTPGLEPGTPSYE
jgi:hypothetical protein